MSRVTFKMFFDGPFRVLWCGCYGFEILWFLECVHTAAGTFHFLRGSVGATATVTFKEVFEGRSVYRV